MRAPHDLPWSALVLSCVATSVVTTLALALVLQWPDKKPAKNEIKTAPRFHVGTIEAKKPVVELEHLAPNDVPLELRVDAYVAPEHIRDFEHRGVFDHCTNVVAVVSAIRPYLEGFFRERAWATASAGVTILKTDGKRDSDDDDDDEEETSSRWRLPLCIDPANSAEIELFPGVDPRTFAPDKIINLDPNAPKYGATGSPRAMSPTARRYSYGRSSRFDDAAQKPPKKHIVVLPGALVLGGVLDVSEGSILIGRHVRIESNAVIKGPCVLGDHTTVRSGAYIRGDVIIGRHVVLRGELKNAVIMDHAELCHPGYCGDSICGYKSHFGNQVTTANLSLMSTSDLQVDVGGTRYDTGRKKLGVVLGDYAQLGCSTVTDPGTFLRPHTIVYPLTRLPRGIYGPNVIVKNKPLEKGVLEITPLRGHVG